VGVAWNADTAGRAAATLAAEFTPIDDLRASAA
jgi:xanthine dehydrogenase iron-sulfur cluster and FAD-binding subunit A